MRLATAKSFFSRSAQGRRQVRVPVFAFGFALGLDVGGETWMEMLGFTHYPLLAGAIAVEVAERLPAAAVAAAAGPASHAFFVTDTPDRLLVAAPRFLGRPVESARHVDV